MTSFVPFPGFTGDGKEPEVHVEESQAGAFEVTFIFPGFSHWKTNYLYGGRVEEFDKIKIAGAGYLAENGRPLLPSLGHYLPVPAGCSASDISIQVGLGNAVDIPGEYSIAPAQQNVTDRRADREYSPDPSGEWTLNRDERCYRLDRYPTRVSRREGFRQRLRYLRLLRDFVGWRDESSLVRVFGPFDLCDGNVLLLHVCPLEYCPRERKLAGYPTIKINIDLGDSAAPGEVTTELAGSGIEPGGTSEPESENPEFLILYADSFRRAAESLREWKIGQGLSTVIADVDSVGGRRILGFIPWPAGQVARIKREIRGRLDQENSRLRYLLLLGDIDGVESEEVDYFCSDYYFATRRDRAHGEGLPFPAVCVGRIPVKTPREAERVVAKIIRYESKSPWTRSDGRVCLVSEFEDLHSGRDGVEDNALIHTMEKIRDNLLGRTAVERVYVETTRTTNRRFEDGRPMTYIPFVPERQAKNALYDAFRRGCLVIAHRGHGRQEGWIEPSFGVADLGSAEDDESMPSLVFSINCRTGEFDWERDCFAEALLKMERGGAVSVVAATGSSNTWHNNSLIKGLFDALWPGVWPGMLNAAAVGCQRGPRLGDAVRYAKACLPLRHLQEGPMGDWIEDAEMYHIIGDPSLKLA